MIKVCNSVACSRRMRQILVSSGTTAFSICRPRSWGLIAQPSLEDTDSIGGSTEQDTAGYASFCVSIAYTLWRNPADHCDPVNVAALDDEQRAALETVPLWPRPQWLVERVQNMRYPQLWEAIRTTWHRDLTGHPSLAQQLVEHANHILNTSTRTRTRQCRQDFHRHPVSPTRR